MSMSLVTALLVSPFIGSFLGVLVMRLPEGRDVVLARSACRACDADLGPADLIPIISWLASRGRCRHCGAGISTFYPLMELSAVGVALWTIAAVPAGMVWVTLCLGWALLALAVMDMRSLFLSDWLTLPLVPAGLAVAWWLEPIAILEHMAGALAGFGILVGAAWGYRALRGREGLGLGDAKLMAAAGAWTGLEGIGTVLLYAVLASFLLALASGVKGRALDATTPVPLGTGLALGIWLAWLYGPLIPAG